MNTGIQTKDERSVARLIAKGVDPRLAKLFTLVQVRPDCPTFIITEVMRTPQRQIELFQAGASKTLNSKHLVGRAADVAIFIGKELRWDWPLYHAFAKIVKDEALKQGIPIEWGGDWKTFKDGPHFQLAD